MRVLLGTRQRSLVEKIAYPTLLMRSALWVGVVLALAVPHGTAARPVGSVTAIGVAVPAASRLRVVRSYEHYLALVRLQARRARRAVRFARRQLGKPYRWGGAGPYAYDCSGLAMAAWKRAGLRLPHRADLQHRVIPRKVRLNHLRPGDLVFFSGNSHVGIYVGRRRFIHAPHTGDVVRHGALTGWRLRAFAGAARPGAPAYRRWPEWVREAARYGRDDAPRPPAQAPVGADPGTAATLVRSPTDDPQGDASENLTERPDPAT